MVRIKITNRKDGLFVGPARLAGFGNFAGVSVCICGLKDVFSLIFPDYGYISTQNTYFVEFIGPDPLETLDFLTAVWHTPTGDIATQQMAS